MAPKQRAMMCKQRVMMQKACYDLPKKNFYGRQTVCYGELRQQRAMAKQRTMTYQRTLLRDPPHFTMCHYVLMEYATGVGHEDRAPHHLLLQADRICYWCGKRRQRTSLHAITC